MDFKYNVHLIKNDIIAVRTIFVVEIIQIYIKYVLFYVLKFVQKLLKNLR